MHLVELWSSRIGVACRPGVCMILSAVVCAFSSSGESGVSENLNIVEPIHNSGAVFAVAVLSRQLSSTVDIGCSVSGIFFLVVLVLWICVNGIGQVLLVSGANSSLALVNSVEFVGCAID